MLCPSLWIAWYGAVWYDEIALMDRILRDPAHRPNKKPMASGFTEE
jgi:hypothetical protein